MNPLPTINSIMSCRKRCRRHNLKHHHWQWWLPEPPEHKLSSHVICTSCNHRLERSIRRAQINTCHNNNYNNIYNTTNPPSVPLPQLMGSAPHQAPQQFLLSYDRFIHQWKKYQIVRQRITAFTRRHHHREWQLVHRHPP